MSDLKYLFTGLVSMSMLLCFEVAPAWLSSIFALFFHYPMTVMCRMLFELIEV
uniref:Uncharacterized protein n=1 Tax=Anguilla anguilla TaxID=7936 RepID=A0A0E9QNW4_ANGAN